MRQRVFRCLVAVCGWLAVAELPMLQASAEGDAEPRWREAGLWRQPEGLPQDSVRTILQTRDGYLWVGTRAGVSRFDGVRFTTFDDSSKTQLRENEVWDLVEGDDSSLWIGVYGGGVSRLEDGQFTSYSTEDGLVDDFVRVLARDTSGGLWIGTDKGVSRLRDGQFRSYTVKEGLLPGSVRAILAAPDGSIQVATPGGLQRIVDDRIERVRLPGMESRPIGVVDALCRDRHGALWIGTSDGLLQVADGTTKRYTTADGLSADAVRKLYEDQAGQLWVATASGLDRSTGTATGGRVFVNESASKDLTALHGDREGGVLVGHRGGGLARFHRGVFSTYTAHDGLSDSEVTTVLHARNGAAWIGSINGLSVHQQGRFKAMGKANGLPASVAAIASLAEDRSGRIWVGTDEGVYRSEAHPRCTDGRCEPHFQAVRGHPVLATQARVILEDRSGAVWIGTNESGLARFEEGSVMTFTTRNGLSNDAIRALAEGKDGSLWIGTKGGGLDRYQGGVFKTFTQHDGLPSPSIQALYMDADETLWIATRRGLSRYREGRFSNYLVADGLFWNHVYDFVEDDQGSLWMISGKGVFRVSMRQLNDFAEGRIRSIVSTVYGREHGLPSTMAAVGTNPGASKGADGRVWFAIVGGLAVADPTQLRTNKVAPPVHIEEVRVDDRVLDLHAAAEAPPGRGDFTFRYTALSYEAPQAVKFKYRLEGFDREWVDAGTRRVAYYTNMPPGHYRFRAIASNSDGVWNERGAEVAVSLAPHFYQTRWFYAAVALALILAGAGTQRLRVRSLQERQRELSARVEEAVAQVKVLSGLLPICASCKKIRDEKGDWSQMEQYIHEHSEAQFSHGICPDCAEKLYPGLSDRARERKTPTPL